MADQIVDDPFLGAEPEVPPPTDVLTEPPPSETPPVSPPHPDDADAEPPPADIEAEPEGEGEGEPPEPPPVETKPGEPPPKAPKRHDENSPWARLKREKKEKEQIAREKDQLAAQLEQLRAERQAEQVRLAEAQRALQGQQAPTEPWKPGTTNRRPTDQELNQLYEEDPLLADRISAEIARQDAAAALQHVQQQTQHMQTQNQIREQIDTFRRSHNDYDDAVKFLEDRERTRLRALRIPEQHMEQMIQARAGLLIQSAINQHLSVPELAYELAKTEGWAAPQPEQPAAPAAPPPTKEPTPAEKVRASRERTQLAATSVGSIPGTPATKPYITRDDVMGMKEEEMERLSRDNPNWMDEVQP